MKSNVAYGKMNAHFKRVEVLFGVLRVLDQDLVEKVEASLLYNLKLKF